MKVRLAIPNKGRLYAPSVELLSKIGIDVPGGRELFVGRDGIEILLARAEDIPKYVETGAADLGITGEDLIIEKNAKVAKLLTFNYGRCSIVLAGKEGATLSSLRGKRIATKLPNIAKRYIARKKLGAKLVVLRGAVEAAPALGVADAIIDHVSTGRTLAAHKLKVIDKIMDSAACLIANKEAQKNNPLVEEIKLSLEGVVRAEGLRYIMVNAPSERALKRIVKVIPGLESPTVLELAKKGTFAVHAVVESKRIARVIRELKKAGGKDILVLRMERVIP